MTKKKSDIKIIVPVHEYSEDVKKMMDAAIQSVPEGFDVVISTTKSLKEAIAKDFKNKIVANGDNGGFCELINQAVGGTKWFSILEFDDAYTTIWGENVKKYLDFMPEISVLLSLEDIYDYQNGKYIGFGNEAPWASSFSDELGYIDKGCLENYFNFFLTGGVFNTDDWNEVGGLKPSIKLTFWYEFLLRLTNKGKKVFVMPKVGYVHMLGREGSLMEQYREQMDADESKFWFDTAKQEYFYKGDRNKTYTKKQEQ
jgi:hypothetical protein